MGFPDSSVSKESACNAADICSIPELGRSPGKGIGYPLQYHWAFLVVQLVKYLPAMQETWVQSLGWKDTLEKGKATHFSILTWRIPWTSHGVAKSETRLSDFHMTRGILALQPGIKLVSPAMEVWCFTHWTTREVSRVHTLKYKAILQSPQCSLNTTFTLLLYLRSCGLHTKGLPHPLCRKGLTLPKETFGSFSQLLGSLVFRMSCLIDASVYVDNAKWSKCWERSKAKGEGGGRG